MNPIRQYVREALQEYVESAQCFDCGTELDFDSSNGRDIETMGGLGVEYLRCPRCGAEYSQTEGGEVCQEKPGNPIRETLTRGELKEVIKQTLRTILNEMRGKGPKLSMLEEGPISATDLDTAWREDNDGEYVQINPDDSVWYVAHRTPKQQIAPKGTPNPFPIIAKWMSRGGVILNIWQVNDHGNVELMSRSGKPLGGLVETLEEMTVTADVGPINLPGNVRGGWVAKQGGSKRALAASTGYTLTPIGSEEMKRKQDPV